MLRMSPSALSRAVRSVEDWCGVSLLVRTSRQVELTRQGRELLPIARRILDEIHVFQAASRLAAEGKLGRLTVGYMDVAISDFLPGLVAGFRAANENVEVDFSYGWRAQQREDLIAGRLDIAFTVGRLPDREIASRKVKDYGLALMVPARHPLASRASVSLADAQDEPFVWGSRDEWQSLHEIVLPICEASGFLPRVVQEAPNRDAILGFVASGLGITVYPRIEGLSMRPDLVPVPIDDTGAELSVYASWLKTPPAIVTNFLDYMAQTAT